MVATWSIDNIIINFSPTKCLFPILPTFCDWGFIKIFCYEGRWLRPPQASLFCWFVMIDLKQEFVLFLAKKTAQRLL